MFYYSNMFSVIFLLHKLMYSFKSFESAHITLRVPFLSLDNLSIQMLFLADCLAKKLSKKCLIFLFNRLLPFHKLKVYEIRVGHSGVFFNLEIILIIFILVHTTHSLFSC